MRFSQKHFPVCIFPEKSGDEVTVACLMLWSEESRWKIGYVLSNQEKMLIDEMTALYIQRGASTNKG